VLSGPHYSLSGPRDVSELSHQTKLFKMFPQQLSVFGTNLGQSFHVTDVDVLILEYYRVPFYGVELCQLTLALHVGLSCTVST
jgi:hypothetical protein